MKITSSKKKGTLLEMKERRRKIFLFSKIF